ncbi:MAG: helix-turn-helix transcriptional regulator [Muribaculaceae bacterium]|nr:helix-turn-helix transcriptional regulator [Muribaculaceae bacterium]
MIRLLQSRIGVGGAEYDCEKNIGYIKSLQELDKDSTNQIDYLYQLCENYQFADHSDSALLIIDNLIDYAYSNHLGNDQFKYTYEKIGILEELGRYEESNTMTDYVLENAPHNSALPYLYFWKALNYFNMGRVDQSAHELAIADSCAKYKMNVDHNYYESFVGPLREFLAYRKNGRIRISQLATVNNSQRELFNRNEYARLETEQNVLKQENKALTFKAQNERKTAILIIVLLVCIIIGSYALWIIQKRKRKTIEAEERAETLQKMVDELSASHTSSSGQDSLRRAMLQQLGIIKMVAETPTEQNRDMLRKLSSIESDTEGALVNWANVFEIIDNLYSGFYTRLHDSYGDVLSDKEEQIIVLMMAGFSTKEISVITSQTTATIYTRKSTIRKKLGVPEKENIVEFVRQGQPD